MSVDWEYVKVHCPTCQDTIKAVFNKLNNKYLCCVCSNTFDKLPLKMVIGKNGGKKADKDKLDWDLLPYEAMEEIIKVLMYGAKKYGNFNWQKVEWKRYESAQMRHKVARRKGEKYDPETGLLHKAHEACSIIFQIWMELNKNES